VSYDRAHQILDLRRAGLDVPDRMVNEALRVTGDLRDEPTLEEITAELAKQRGQRE
jgi:hypothetical protein